jgi:hypothetical protein
VHQSATAGPLWEGIREKSQNLKSQRLLVRVRVFIKISLTCFLVFDKQVQPSPDFNTSARIMKRLCIPNVFTEYVPRRPLDYYTCNFRKSKMDRCGAF